MQPLYIVHTGTFFVELINLARYINQVEGVYGTFMFYPHSQAQRDALIVESIGMKVIDSEGKKFADYDCSGASDKRKSTLIISITKRIISALRRVALFEFLIEVFISWDRKRFMTIWLSQNQFDIVVLGGDMVGYDTSSIIAASHQNNIPVVIVPSTMSNGKEQAEVYKSNPRHNCVGLLNRFVAKFYPQWTLSYEDKVLLRESGARALALEILGLAPPKPWVFNSGDADAIALESNAMLDYYLACGIERLSLTITGAPTDDLLAERMAIAESEKDRICKALRLAPNKPLVAVALPPDFLYVTGGRPECDFVDYKKLLDFWFSSLGEMDGFNIVICPHPSVDKEYFKHRELCNLKISTFSTAELVPICDVYIASVSSTIRWAISCGKPVINYDVYRYRYTDFLNVPGVVHIENQDSFQKILLKICSDPKFLQEISLMQSRVANYWGVNDGQSRHRIYQLMRNLMLKFKTCS